MWILVWWLVSYRVFELKIPAHVLWAMSCACVGGVPVIYTYRHIDSQADYGLGGGNGLQSRVRSDGQGRLVKCACEANDLGRSAGVFASCLGLPSRTVSATSYVHCKAFSWRLVSVVIVE
jgi:hypothetical protein